ncbi:MAG TPA: hypothetical protein VMV45_17365 [Casimicrobiaceae bacterium]|nr:hypothetical protein [Casimicrobiaceae bacterium]
MNTMNARSDADAIRERVLRAIEANRTPGYHFPGYFLGIRWSEVTPDSSRLWMPDGVHLRDEHGAVDRLAITALADLALGTAARAADRTEERLSTVHLQLQFTGAVARGDISANGRLLGHATGTALEQRLTVATLYAGGEPICYASGEFVRLATPAGVALGPLPWQRPMSDVSPADEATLSEAERAIVDACDAHFAKSSDGIPFLRRFWLGRVDEHGDGGELRVSAGLRIGNRVGHVQGGISVGIAAQAACAAAPRGMGLSNVSAWYVSPGHGSLRARAQVIHAGRNTALVRSVIEGDDGRTVLEAVTQHIALAS